MSVYPRPFIILMVCTLFIDISKGKGAEIKKELPINAGNIALSPQYIRIANTGKLSYIYMAFKFSLTRLNK